VVLVAASALVPSGVGDAAGAPAPAVVAPAAVPARIAAMRKPMSEDDEINQEVAELFNRHFRSDQTLNDIKALDALLPDNSRVLRVLGERCLKEARKAIHAGHHMEGRRLDILGRQLQKRAENAKP
jgi:hypothetical protein